jgi:hypothetical protein
MKVLLPGSILFLVTKAASGNDLVWWWSFSNEFSCPFFPNLGGVDPVAYGLVLVNEKNRVNTTSVDHQRKSLSTKSQISQEILEQCRTNSEIGFWMIRWTHCNNAQDMWKNFNLPLAEKQISHMVW